MSNIAIGKIVKPQGILGEIKVFSYLDDAKTFCLLKEIKIMSEKNPRKIEKVRVQKDFVFIKLEGLNSRDDAEALKYKEIEMDREELKKLLGSEDSVFYDDVVGMDIICAGKVIGQVVSITDMPSLDVVNASGKKDFSFPLVDDIIVYIDEQKRTVELNEDRFNEVVVYED